MERTVFVPDVSSRDWASFAALIAVALLIVAFVLMFVRSSRSRPTWLATALAATPLLAGLWSLLVARQPQFTQIVFSQEEMVVSTLGQTTVLKLLPENSAIEGSGAVTFASGNTSVELPLQGTWRLDGLVVDARYLANEFRGRSR